MTATPGPAGRRGAEIADDLEEQPRAPVEIAAVSVGAAILRRVEESADQIAVGAVKLDAREAGGDEPGGGVGESRAHLGDLGERQCSRLRNAPAS